MIIRKQTDGSLLVIGQTDHSRFVGQLAAHWGNADVAVPRPYESVVRAATFHDYGWLRYETSPLLDEATGEPYSFLKVPLTDAQLASYTWSLDWMSDIDPYAGLIVSMHRTGLWKSRYDLIKHPMGYNLGTLSPPISALIARYEASQAAERARHDDADVWTNYRLMQVWDLLGLYFCCQDPYADHIDPVPMSYGAGADAGTRMSMQALTPRRVAFDPFPFDARGLHVQLSSKRLAAAKYPDVAAFRKAYFQAPVELIDYELV